MMIWMDGWIDGLWMHIMDHLQLKRSKLNRWWIMICMDDELAKVGSLRLAGGRWGRWRGSTRPGRGRGRPWSRRSSPAPPCKRPGWRGTRTPASAPAHPPFPSPLSLSLPLCVSVSVCGRFLSLSLFINQVYFLVSCFSLLLCLFLSIWIGWRKTRAILPPSKKKKLILVQIHLGLGFFWDGCVQVQIQDLI